jgi:hypothetical protein
MRPAPGPRTTKLAEATNPFSRRPRRTAPGPTLAPWASGEPPSRYGLGSPPSLQGSAQGLAKQAAGGGRSKRSSQLTRNSTSASTKTTLVQSVSPRQFHLVNDTAIHAPYSSVCRRVPSSPPCPLRYGTSTTQSYRRPRSSRAPSVTSAVTMQTSAWRVRTRRKDCAVTSAPGTYASPRITRATQAPRTSAAGGARGCRQRHSGEAGAGSDAGPGAGLGAGPSAGSGAGLAGAGPPGPSSSSSSSSSPAARSKVSAIGQEVPFKPRGI